MIIGLTGTAGSGKDTVADYLKKKGFSYHSCSDIIRDECEKLGIETNRDNLIAKGNELREEFGPNILAKRIAEKIRQKNEENSLVVSIRNPREVEELKKQEDFIMIAVDAPIELRYERITKRQRPEDAVSFEKFKEQEHKERTGNEKQQQLDKVIAMADHVIINDGTLEEFNNKVNELLSKIEAKTI